MKRTRKVLASLLAAVLLACLLPATALASDTCIKDKNCTATVHDATCPMRSVTRAELAEMIYNNELLRTNLQLAGGGNTESPFTDLTEENGCTSTQATAINALYNAQVISGTTATTFAPQNPVTRGEAIVIIWRATGCRTNNSALAEDYFGDSLAGWYAPAVNCFYGAGLVKGNAASEEKKPTFGGDQPMPVVQAQAFISSFQEDNQNYKDFINSSTPGAVTRAEMTVEFYNRFSPMLSDLPTTEGGKALYEAFSDISGCTEEQKTAIQFFTERGIITGTGNNAFTPYGPVSNLQLASLLQKCATKELPTQDTVNLNDGETMSMSVVSMAGSPLDEIKALFGADSTVVETITDNPNAPGLTRDLTSWSDSLKPQQPTINGGSTITSGQTLNVTISCDTEDAVIYYTIDNSDPTISATRKTYSEAQSISITKPTTLKAVAVKNNLVSTVAQVQYAYPALTLTPSATSLTGGGTVTLTVGGAGASVAVSVTCSNTAYHPTRSTNGTWTVTLPNATATYTFTAAADGYTSGTCTVSVTRYDEPSNPGGGSSSGGSSSSGSSSNTTTETSRNPDGSTTTTATNTATGTVTETTQYPDGSREVVETKKDGTTTTTTTDASGNRTETVENPDGSAETVVTNKNGASSTTTVSKDGRVTAEVKLPAGVVESAGDGAVALPMPAVPVTSDRSEAPAVTLDLPSGTSARVEIPVKNVTPGTVAVLVKADGSEEVIKTSLTTESGVAVTLTDGDTVKIVDNSKTFADVPGSYWGAEAVAFAASRELFNGTGDALFSPDASMNRAMIVTVLARLDGVDTAGENWYDAGARWAVANGISDGSNLDQSLTREQLAVMLYRYAGSPAVSGSLSAFSDSDGISGYAVDAMTWAVDMGLINGVGGNSLSSQSSASRVQVAAILMRYLSSQAI